MTPLLRRRLIIWSIAGVISCIAIWIMTSMQPESLTAGVTSTAEFDRRLKARFAVGSPERDLVKELQREGFTTQQSQATRNAACTARVEWKSDSAGRLTAIGGTCS